MYKTQKWPIYTNWSFSYHLIDILHKGLSKRKNLLTNNFLNLYFYFFRKRRRIKQVTLTSKFKRLPPSTPQFRIFDIGEFPVFVCKDYLPSPLKNGATCRRITLNIGVRKFCRFGKTHGRFADFFFMYKCIIESERRQLYS